MRIFSSWKEPYDALQDYKDDLVYDRKYSEVLIPIDRNSIISKIPHWTAKYSRVFNSKGRLISFSVLCIADTYYPCSMLSDKELKLSIDDMNKALEFVNTYRSFFLQDMNFQNIIQDLPDFSEEYNCPVWLLQRDIDCFKLCLNPVLYRNGLGLDIHQVYQEIDMWLGQRGTKKVLNPENTEDKYRMQSRFDKYSFRRMKCQ